MKKVIGLVLLIVILLSCTVNTYALFDEYTVVQMTFLTTSPGGNRIGVLTVGNIVTNYDVYQYVNGSKWAFVYSEDFQSDGWVLANTIRPGVL